MKQKTIKSEETKGNAVLHSVGTRCYWNSIINGKITKLVGKIIEIPKTEGFPYKLKGRCLVTGNEYEELVYDGGFNVEYYAEKVG